MFDKILLTALILLLPITILLTNFYAQKSQQQTVSKENFDKVNLMLDQLQKSIVSKPQETLTPQISVTTVYFASESGELIISGVAPKSDLSLQLSVLEKNPTTVESTSSAVLGDSIDVRALPVSGDGLFKYIHLLDKKNVPDKLEVKLEQGPASKTILYHFKSNTFEQY